MHQTMTEPPPVGGGSVVVERLRGQAGRNGAQVSSIFGTISPAIGRAK